MVLKVLDNRFFPAFWGGMEAQNSAMRVDIKLLGTLDLSVF